MNISSSQIRPNTPHIFLPLKFHASEISRTNLKETFPSLLVPFKLHKLVRFSWTRKAIAVYCKDQTITYIVEKKKCIFMLEMMVGV
jgi:hypothetical protein